MTELGNTPEELCHVNYQNKYTGAAGGGLLKWLVIDQENHQKQDPLHRAWIF